MRKFGFTYVDVWGLFFLGPLQFDVQNYLLMFQYTFFKMPQKPSYWSPLSNIFSFLRSFIHTLLRLHALYPQDHHISNCVPPSKDLHSTHPSSSFLLPRLFPSLVTNIHFIPSSKFFILCVYVYIFCMLLAAKLDLYLVLNHHRYTTTIFVRKLLTPSVDFSRASSASWMWCDVCFCFCLLFVMMAPAAENDTMRNLNLFTQSTS